MGLSFFDNLASRLFKYIGWGVVNGTRDALTDAYQNLKASVDSLFDRLILQLPKEISWIVMDIKTFIVQNIAYVVVAMAPRLAQVLAGACLAVSAIKYVGNKYSLERAVKHGGEEGEIESSDVLTGLLATMFGVTRLPSVIKKAGSLIRDTSTVTSFISGLARWLYKVLSYCFGDETRVVKWLKTLISIDSEVYDFHAGVKAMVDSGRVDQIKEFLPLFQTHIAKARKAFVEATVKDNKVVLYRIYTDLLTWEAMANRANSQLDKPTVMFLSGDCGLGKSRLAMVLAARYVADYLLENLKATRESVYLDVEKRILNFPYLSKFIYVRKSGEKFWEGFTTSHYAVIFDDISNSDSEASKRLVDEFHQYSEIGLLYPPQAGLEEKHIYFNAKLIIATSNYPYLASKTPDSDVRRFQNHVIVRKKNGGIVPSTFDSEFKHLEFVACAAPERFLTKTFDYQVDNDYFFCKSNGSGGSNTKRVGDYYLTTDMSRLYQMLKDSARSISDCGLANMVIKHGLVGEVTYSRDENCVDLKSTQDPYTDDFEVLYSQLSDEVVIQKEPSFFARIAKNRFDDIDFSMSVFKYIGKATAAIIVSVVFIAAFVKLIRSVFSTILTKKEIVTLEGDDWYSLDPVSNDEWHEAINKARNDAKYRNDKPQQDSESYLQEASYKRASDPFAKFHHAFFPVVVQTKTGEGTSAKAIAIGKQTVMMPLHYLVGNKCDFSISFKLNNKIYTNNILYSDCQLFENYDVIVFDVPSLPLYTTLKLGSVTEFDSFFVLTDGKVLNVDVNKTQKKVDARFQGKVFTDIVITAPSIKNAGLGAGSCGSPLIGCKNGVSALVGFYVGSSESTFHFTPVPDVVRKNADCVSIECDLSVLFDNDPYCMENYQHLGQVEVPPSMKQMPRNDIVQTPAQVMGLIPGEPYRYPVIPTEATEIKAMHKKDVPIHNITPNTIKLVHQAGELLQQHYAQKFSECSSLGIEEAILGTTNYGDMGAIDINTSPGFTLRTQGKDKEDVMTFTNDGKPDVKLDVDFKNMLVEDWRKWIHGDKVGYVFSEHQKIELRERERVVAGKLRIFSGGDLRHLICGRRAIGDFYEQWRIHQMFNFVGGDVGGLDFHQLIQDAVLRTPSNEFGCFDFSGYDATIPNVLVKEAIRIIKSFYPNHQDKQAVELCFLENMIAFRFVRGQLYCSLQGNCSGFVYTTMLNTIVNNLIFSSCVLSKYPNIDPFSEYFLVAFGDDSVYGNSLLYPFSPLEYSDLVNSMFGMKMEQATENKEVASTVGFVDWKNILFLKRKPHQNDHPYIPKGVYYGRLDKGIVYDILRYHNRRGTAEDYAGNIRSFVLESLYHTSFEEPFKVIRGLTDRFSMEARGLVNLPEVVATFKSKFTHTSVTNVVYPHNLSNFTPVKLKINYKGTKTEFPSVEVAYQYIKAIEHGRTEIARTILSLKPTPKYTISHQAKAIQRRLNSSPRWLSIRDDVMIGLLRARAAQDKSFVLDPNTHYRHPVPDQHWGIPGCNTFGKMLDLLALELFSKSS